MPTYSEIYKIEDPKEKIWAAIERIKEIKSSKPFTAFTIEQEHEIRSLEIMKMELYSAWKDPQ